MKDIRELKARLRSLGSPRRAEHAKRFFKTGPGQYGEGDIFIGVKVPEMRDLVKRCRHFKKSEIIELLKSEVHEDRFCGLAIMVDNFKKSKNPTESKAWFDLYLKHKERVNNWDLVDGSTYHIVGGYCFKNNNVSIIKKMIHSKHHWDRRIAMVSTLAFIRNSQYDLTYYCALQVIGDKEDLMHKASGWMLREAGKRDPKLLLDFIDKHGSKMPRTMLRYAIEKFSDSQRKRILLKTKMAKA